MKGVLLLAILVVSFVSVHTVYADNSQYTKIFLDPFYKNAMPININQSWNVTVVPNQQIAVSSAIISFDVYITPTVNFSLWVNRQRCNTQSYFISTTFASAGQSRITFDCSNVITKSGTYAVNLQPAQASTGSVTGWLDVSYQTDAASVLVHGTEYTRGIDTTGKIFVQLIRDNSTIDNSSCTTTAYFPAGNRFIDTQPMTFLEKGLYYYDFTVAENQTLGVYPATVDCLFPVQFINSTADNEQIVQGTSGAGTLNNTFFQDGLFKRYTESLVIARRVDVILNYTIQNITVNTTELRISTYTSWTGGGASETILVSVFNFSSSTWLLLPNQIPDVNGYITILNDIPQNFSDFVNNNITRLRFNDSASLVDAANSNFDVDQAVIIKITNTPVPQQHLQGSGELHISPLVVSQDNITAIVNNQYALNLSVMSILGYVQQINVTTMMNNILLQSINSTVTAINNYLNGFVTTILLQINATVSAINFQPNITVNVTNNITQNNSFLMIVINDTVVVNTTNTTVVVNTTVVNLTNTTVVINTTNTTVVVNTTAISPVFNITVNSTVNTTQLINDILNAQITETIL